MELGREEGCERGEVCTPDGMGPSRENLHRRMTSPIQKWLLIRFLSSPGRAAHTPHIPAKDRIDLTSRTTQQLGLPPHTHTPTLFQMPMAPRVLLLCLLVLAVTEGHCREAAIPGCHLHRE